MTGPWQTRQVIQTSSGTSAGTVITSPSGLRNGGADFDVWLRALPLVYTSAFAGYTDSVGPFRYLATTVTVPPVRIPAANGALERGPEFQRLAAPPVTAPGQRWPC